MESLHSKRTTYLLLTFGALAFSVVFAYRAGAVYVLLFTPVMGFLAALFFGIVAGVAITVASFVMSLNWHNDKLHKRVLMVILLHDWGGVFYTVYADGFGQFLLRLAPCLGLCAVSSLPFIFGVWLKEVAAQLPKEREDTFRTWVADTTRRIQQEAALLYQRLAHDPDMLMLYAPDELRQYVESKGKRLVIVPKKRLFFFSYLQVSVVDSVPEQCAIERPAPDELQTPPPLEFPYRRAMPPQSVSVHDEVDTDIVILDSPLAPVPFPLRNGHQGSRSTQTYPLN